MPLSVTWSATAPLLRGWATCEAHLLLVAENASCFFPGKWAGVVIASAILGGLVNRCCSFGKGVYGGLVEGDSITQLARCERMR